MSRHDWMDHANCTPRNGEKPDPRWTAENPPNPTDEIAMFTICAHCPVRRECATYAIEQHLTGGYYAGVWLPNPNSGNRDQTRTRLRNARNRLTKTANPNPTPTTATASYAGRQTPTRAEERKTLVLKLHNAGLTVTEIAAATGASRATINTDLKPARPNPTQHRTQRRTHVANLHAQGHTLREIARQLGISHTTVKSDLDATHTN